MLAPTGTIAFMMDCDTTGVEPDIALIKYKKLVGEGFLKIVNQTVPAALRKLGYSPTEVEEIIAYVDERETIEGAPGLKPEHLPVFDCAFKPMNGERSIHYMGHVRMMGAIQPFLSGAISKTVNMPEAATAEEIETVYLEGWKLGLKAIAIYRDGSKRTPAAVHRQEEGRRHSPRRPSTIESLRAQLAAAQVEATRRTAAGSRPSARAITHKFDDRRPRGLHHRRPVRGRPARRDLPQDGQGRLHDRRPDGHARDHRPRWRSSTACRSRRWSNKFAHVRFEPSGLHRQPGDPDRQVDRGLRLPLAGLAVPAAPSPRSAAACASRSSSAASSSAAICFAFRRAI